RPRARRCGRRMARPPPRRPRRRHDAVRPVLEAMRGGFRPLAPRVRRAGVLHDAPEGAHTVAPADLLALGIGTAVVGDADLEHAPTGRGHLGGDLRLEAESLLFDRDRVEDLLAKGLEAGLHV